MSSRLLQLVEGFRLAIDKAKENSEIKKDIAFRDFPTGCCGDTSELLACYLKKHGYDTVYVCGCRGDQSHAWLVLMDENVIKPEPKFYVTPDDIKDVLNLYGGGGGNEPVDVTRYEAENVENGFIIDITADQFWEMKNCPVFLGYMDSFHREFKFCFAHEYNGLGTVRLEILYRLISFYL